MTNKEKDQKDTLSFIHKASEAELVSQKSLLRKYMDTEILNELLKRWSGSSNDEFRTAIFQIFSDIKEQEALPYVMEALEKEKDLERKNEIISILWMSSIDSSEHLVDLVNIALGGNYMTVLEISTVIESFDSEFGEDEVIEAMYQIDEKLLEIDTQELADMIANLKEVINKLTVT